MPRAVVQVRGAKELRKTLRAAGDDLSDLRDTHREIAGIVTPRGRGLAPVGASGQLAASVRGSGTKTASIIRAGRKKIPYAGPIHWGWPTRPNAEKGIRGGPIKANTFLATAAKQTEPEWVDRYMAATEQALQKVEGI